MSTILDSFDRKTFLPAMILVSLAITLMVVSVVISMRGTTRLDERELIREEEEELFGRRRRKRNWSDLKYK